MPILWLLGALFGADYAQKKGLIKPIWTSPTGPVRPGRRVGRPEEPVEGGRRVGVAGRGTDSMFPGTVPGGPVTHRPVGPPATPPGLQTSRGQRDLVLARVAQEKALRDAERADLDVEGKVAAKAQMLPMFTPITPELAVGPHFGRLPPAYTPDTVSIEELGAQGTKASQRGGRF